MAGRTRKPDYKSLTDRSRRALLAVAKMLAFDPHNAQELAAAAVGDPPPARGRNPIRLHAETADPRLREISERFHGTPDEVAVLGDDQRQPPPRDVVVIGEEVATAYRPDPHSRRGEIDWEHEVGDQGEGRPKLRGKRYLVTDGNRVWSVPGSRPAHFDPDRGIVG